MCVCVYNNIIIVTYYHYYITIRDNVSVIKRGRRYNNKKKYVL